MMLLSQFREEMATTGWGKVVLKWGVEVNPKLAFCSHFPLVNVISYP